MVDDTAIPLPGAAERELTEAEMEICSGAAFDLSQTMCDVFGKHNLSPHMAMAVIGNAVGELIDSFPNTTPVEKQYAAEVVKGSLDATLRGLASEAGACTCTEGPA